MEQLTEAERQKIAFLLFSGSMRSGMTFEDAAALAKKIGLEKEMQHWKDSWEFERPIIEAFLNHKNKKK